MTRQHLTKSDLEDLHAVMRRAVERAEAQRDLTDQEIRWRDQLAFQVRQLADELKERE
ncbi:MAG: hypothetical protein JWP08_1915 [Bryobacterales bacterium]|nr:hypothetical protein [Bryobacterales bacterium]